MPEPLSCVPADCLITGWDFSTSAVKCLAFDLQGEIVAEVRLPTDLWDRDGVSELNLMQLEGQARASTRGLAAKLRDKKRLQHWVAGGISATHHTAGRLDANQVQVRRAICWNDQSLIPYHEKGLARLGGQDAAQKHIGGPWAIRYTLTHLLKDAHRLAEQDWKRTQYILPHGALAAGFLTGNFGVVSVSAAASTGIMDLRTNAWSRPMLDALEEPWQRELAWQQLPKIIEQNEPVGRITETMAREVGREGQRPIIFPTSDDQQAGLVGGGAVNDGQLAIVLGSSAVVNSSSAKLPASGSLDAMRLNWGPYLWMRCYNNGAQFLDKVVGSDPDWDYLEQEARQTPAGCEGTVVLPFVHPEPSLQLMTPRFAWKPASPEQSGRKFRAALEALAYLIALAVREHESAGQRITQITVSGGIARSNLMCEILASVLNRPLHRLVSTEGPALGAAVTALAAYETFLRKEKGITRPFTVADAVAVLVKFRDIVQPNSAWQPVYVRGLRSFEEMLVR